MKSNELQHYGVKGMRWKHTKSHSGKSADMKRASSIRSESISKYISNNSVSGSPNYVYDEKGNVVDKETYTARRQDPLYDFKRYANAEVKSLPDRLVMAGKETLDSFFGLNNKQLQRMKNKKR